MDMPNATHSELLDAVVDDSFDLNLAEVGPVLDALAEATTEVRVRGAVREEHATEATDRKSAGSQFKLGLSPKGIDGRASTKFSTEASVRTEHRTLREVNIEHRVHFGRVGAAIHQLTSVLRGKRAWLLLDEWSVVPLELQPYLADLLRRAVFPATSISVKIGAIERRSRFQIHLDGSEYIGIELGGDASADLNMDDFMVFDNDEEKAVSFFKSLIYRHVKTLAEEQNLRCLPTQQNSSGSHSLKRTFFANSFAQPRVYPVMPSIFYRWQHRRTMAGQFQWIRYADVARRGISETKRRLFRQMSRLLTCSIG